MRKYRLLIGVDAHGEPDGQVNEEAQALMDTGFADYTGPAGGARATRAHSLPAQSRRHHGGAGCRGHAEGLPVYEKLLSAGHLTVHATLAQYFNPDRNRDAQGQIDYAGMVARATAVRDKYATNPLVRANFVKIFADGVAEGNPFATPPTLGNAAMLAPYLQPRFARDAEGRPTVIGYVDTDSALCQDVREHPEQVRGRRAVCQGARLSPRPVPDLERSTQGRSRL